MRTSFNDGWQVRPKVNRFLELSNAVKEAEAVTLPHDAMIGTARDPSASHMNAYFTDGVWEYTKTFALPPEWRDRRVRLHFEGVYREAMVYVNDDFAANEPNGYAEFMVDLDPFLHFGEENTIKVECRAGDDARWYSGAGIYRPVTIWVQAPIHVVPDGVWVTTPEVDEESAVVEIAAEVRNDTGHTATARLAAEVHNEAGDLVASGTIPVTLRPHTTVVARQRLYVAQPRLWSPQAPQLHSCITRLSTEDGTELDQHRTTFGIRSLRLDPAHGLRINGLSVKLRGACVHHDNGPIGAATITRAEERRVELLKAAGFNAMRSAHNPASRAMLDACDRLGVIVMDEAWDTWTEGKRDHDQALRFDERWRTDLASMTRKDRNHPSVVLYSTGNEISEVGSPLGAARARDIAEHLRSLDPTRYVTNAVQPLLAIRNLFGRIAEVIGQLDDDTEPEAREQPRGVNTQMAMWTTVKERLMRAPMVAECIEEVCATLDVAGYNYLDVRYLTDHKLSPNRVIVGSETYVTAIGRNWPTITTHDHLVGDFTWSGWDYLGEVGIGRTDYGASDDAASTAGVVGAYPWLVANTGDIDITGVRRPASYFRETVYGLRDDPYIAVQRPAHAGQPITYAGPWTWSDTLASWTWDGFEGTSVTAEVYSAADEVELLRNGTSIGQQPAGPSHGFRAEFHIAYEPGELVAIATVAGQETGRTALRTASGPRRLIAEPDRHEITTGDTDLAFVALGIADAAGIVDPGADRIVTVAVRGPAIVQGFASADPLATEPFTSTTCTTYDGRALAVIRPTGAGVIDVAFRADGLDPATCRLTAVERP
jgi:beta-galactosidase